VPTDLQFQVDISARLVVAAVFGAMIGLEREIHGHQAGVRTHMLVSLGSAIFTVLSSTASTRSRALAALTRVASRRRS